MEETGGETQSPEPVPRIIGLTGGIGSGKSTVAQFIEAMGFPIYYSDVRAKDIVNDDNALKMKIIELLGENAYNPDGQYNRKWVASQVFENNALLSDLNALIHPAVKVDFEQWVAQQTTELVFKETALLFELNLDQNCYKSILITAEDNLRIKRVMDRDGKTYREVEAIMNQQMPEKDKIRKADYIIYNNGGLPELQSETERTIHQLIQEIEA